jgi:hypothetical protein
MKKLIREIENELTKMILINPQKIEKMEHPRMIACEYS